jgi:Ala-tRNA(Pro) deacylase
MYALDYLRSRGVWYEALLHRPASSSTKRAGCVHVPGRKVAKAVLVRAGESFVLAVLPSTAQIDLARLSGVVEEAVSRVRLATLDELCAVFPNCEPGVVPPFGRLYGLKTLVDSALADSSEIIVGGNTRHEDLRMLFSDFQRLEEPVAASFTRPLAPEFEHRKAVGRERNRRAG